MSCRQSIFKSPSPKGEGWGGAFLLLFLLLCSPLSAKINLPSIFADNMVLQRDSKVNIWGTAAANSSVTLSPSWAKAKTTVKSGADGKWQAVLATPSAGGPYIIKVEEGAQKAKTDAVILKNILIGEVWICSGQSNMEMPMKGYKNQPVENAVSDILHSADEGLRLFTVKRQSSLLPKDDVQGEWQEAEPQSVREFSATAYYFGRELRRMLNVPVGLIVSAWGGSSCEAWLAADWLKAFPESKLSAKLPLAEGDIKSKNRTPTVLYNGMLRPLIGYTMRGCIWYQGEDNVPRYTLYADLLTRMVEGWREEWRQGDFPFYYCQIAPYDYSLINMRPNSAFLREQQMRAEQRIPNSGMAVLMDAGMDFGIHPRRKDIAGERLALLALDNTYGVKGLTSRSAYFKEATFSNDTCAVSFERADMWVYGAKGYISELFEVAGKDKVFHPAKAWVQRSKVMVVSPEVKEPVAVRYAFKNYVKGDLFCDGLPISSFRSDDWDEVE